MNEKRFEDLAEFVQNAAVHNDRTLIVAEFQGLLRRGLPSAGRAISFVEHVFYQYQTDGSRRSGR